MATVAKLAGVSLTTLRHINPAFPRLATPPGDNYYLVLPITRILPFVQNLAAHADTTCPSGSTTAFIEEKHCLILPNKPGFVFPT